jgi:hypothetical protein
MPTQEVRTERRREDRARHLAWRQGYLLRKSRIREVNLDNLGGYMLIDANMNCIVAGSRWDLSLEEVEDWLADD